MTEIHLLTYDKSAYLTESALQSLQLEKFVETAGLTEEESGVFLDVLRHPLRDTDSALERQLVFRDFLRFPAVADGIHRAAERSESRNTARSGYDRTDPSEKVKMAADELCEGIESLRRLIPVFSDRSFLSGPLRELRDRLNALDAYPEFESHICEMAQQCAKGCAEIALTYRDSLKPSAGLLFSFGDRIGTQRMDKRIKNRCGGDLFDYREHFIMKVVVGHIVQGNIKHMANTLSSLSKAIRSFLRNLSRETLFFTSSGRVMTRLQHAGFAVCIPQLIGEPGVIRAGGIYDPLLAVCDCAGERPVPNSIDSHDGMMYLISGPNRGGKTSFLRSIGIAQLFTQSGIFVPAERCECSVFGGIVTHFPDAEDETLRCGLLAEELTEFRKEFLRMPPGSLVLLNDSFASTSDREGSDIAEDAMKALTLTGAKVFYVTHLTEFLMRYRSLQQQMPTPLRVVSLTAGTGECDEPTFRISEGEPKESYVVPEEIGE